MLRQSSLKFILFAIVLTLIAAAGAQAGTMYAAAVSALNPPIYLRLDESGTDAELGDAVANSGSLGTAVLNMAWGIHLATTGYYESSQPFSGENSIRPSTMLAGNPSLLCLGLEDNNTGARFLASTGSPVNSRALNVKNTSTAGEQVPAMDQENQTYSLFFNTTDANQNPRMITSHPDNANRFDLIMTYGKLCLVTGNVSTTTNWFADSTPGSATFNDGNWHHLVAVRNGDDPANAKLYVDGQEISLAAAKGTPAYMSGGTAPHAGSTATNSGLRIGSHGNINRGWTGTMDEIAMWGSALSAAEVQGLLQAATVPEPSTMVLLAAMLLGGVAFFRRKS
jgi:hypothetical protein